MKPSVPEHLASEAGRNLTYDCFWELDLENLHTVLCNCETGFEAGRSGLIFSEAGQSGLMRPTGPDLLAS